MSYSTLSRATKGIIFFIYLPSDFSSFSVAAITLLSGSEPLFSLYSLCNVFSTKACHGGNSLATQIVACEGFLGGPAGFLPKKMTQMTMISNHSTVLPAHWAAEKRLACLSRKITNSIIIMRIYHVSKPGHLICKF